MDRWRHCVFLLWGPADVFHCILLHHCKIGCCNCYLLMGWITSGCMFQLLIAWHMSVTISSIGDALHFIWMLATFATAVTKCLGFCTAFHIGMSQLLIALRMSVMLSLCMGHQIELQPFSSIHSDFGNANWLRQDNAFVTMWQHMDLLAHQLKYCSAALMEWRIPLILPASIEFVTSVCVCVCV